MLIKPNKWVTHTIIKKRNCNNFFDDEKGKKVQLLLWLTSNTWSFLIETRKKWWVLWVINLWNWGLSNFPAKIISTKKHSCPSLKGVQCASCIDDVLSTREEIVCRAARRSHLPWVRPTQHSERNFLSPSLFPIPFSLVCTNSLWPLCPLRKCVVTRSTIRDRYSLSHETSKKHVSYNCVRHKLSLFSQWVALVKNKMKQRTTIASVICGLYSRLPVARNIFFTTKSSAES